MPKKIFINKKVSDSYKILRVICGPMRFKIIVLLRQNKKGLNVTALGEALGASLSRISHQLSILKKHKLISGSGSNRETVYRLSDHRLRKYLNIILK